MTSKYRLYTPEEISAETEHLSAYQIRSLARKGLIEHTRGAGQKILLTRAQADGLMEYLTAPARPDSSTTPAEPEAPRSPAEVVSMLGGSRRSKSARRARVRA